MPLKLRDGNVWRSLQALRAYHLGAWRPIRQLRVYHNDAWRIVFQASGTIAVTDSIDPVGVGGINSTVQGGSTTAQVSGGIPPYTYAWALISSTGGNDPTALKPTFATTGFRKTGMIEGDQFSAVFRCTVTDAIGANGTCDTTVNFTRIQV